MAAVQAFVPVKLERLDLSLPPPGTPERAAAELRAADRLLAELFRPDQPRWAAELGASGFASFADAALFLAAALLGAGALDDSLPLEPRVLAVLAQRRRLDPALAAQRALGVPLHFPPPPPRSLWMDAPFATPVCFDCGVFGATWTLAPCRCRALCGRCAFVRRQGAWSTCPKCGAANKGRVLRRKL